MRNLCGDIGKYLKYAVPSAIMQIFDVFTYEVSVIGAAFLGRNELSAHIAVLATNCLIFMISTGISESSCALIGNYVGKKKPKTAQKIALASLLLVLAIVTPIFILYWFFRHEIAPLYSYEPEVVEIILYLIPIMIAVALFDSVHTVLGGICKSLALQKIAAILVLVSYYMIGVPLGYYFTFHTEL